MSNFFTFISEQWLLISALLALLYLLIWRESRKSGQALSCMEATRMLNDNSAIIIDIRNKKEYTSGHILGAINISLSDIDKGINQVSKHKDKTLIITDKLGQYTSTAASKIQAHGFTTSRLKGGMTEWLSNNLPVVKK